MPYFIWDESPECSGWAVVKEDGELMSCHKDKQSAIEAMVGVSAAEGIEPGGSYEEEHDEEIEIEETELREVNLTPPAYMRAAARQGLRYYEEGKAGDGVVDATIREARAMAAGNVTADKWVRIRAWISRHLVDLDSAAARPDSPDYPSPGVVAHLLWGSGPSKAAARRALAYAEGVVSRMEEENEGRAKGEALSKIETRVFTNEFEVREDGEGMTLTGYAARFNEPSEPLPFIERIKPGAFKRSINSRNDIKLLWNHNTDMVLGSTRAGTLTLKEDEVGLRVVASLPDTSYGRDAKVSIQRGDVTGFSFGFTVPAGGDSWSADGSERTLKSVRLMEVSTGVAFPAYPSTNGTAQVRGLDKVAERNNVDADALADALLKIEDGQTISVDEAAMLSRVINDLAPAEEVAQPNGDLGMLALKKKKLELLIKGI
jgi:HK97 family phage prohead protease